MQKLLKCSEVDLIVEKKKSATWAVKQTKEKKYDKKCTQVP